MLDIHRLREDPIGIEKRLRDRDPSIDLSEIAELDKKRLSLIQQVEEYKAERNRGSQDVGRLKAEGKDASELLATLSSLSEKIGGLDIELKNTQERIDSLIAVLPNLPHPSVPVGKKDEKVVLRTHNELPSPDFPVKHHLEIGEEKGILDFGRAATIAGARFPMYVGMGARLEMALIQFMFFHHASNGYTPVLPPFLANSKSFFVASQLPKFADDIYHCEKDDLYLNPTAESVLVNMHRDDILMAEDLPLDYVAYTPCFRREAGTYGEEERGLIRVHQFNKVELFKFTTQESSYEQLDELVAAAEKVLQELGIHYRVVLLPTTDLAQQSSKTIDLEVYLPGQGRYYEVSSCSNCEDFQARRAGTRYRPGPEEKPLFVHTLNASGLATPRLLAAILENNQRQDGSVLVPKVLQAMVGAEYI